MYLPHSLRNLISVTGNETKAARGLKLILEMHWCIHSHADFSITLNVTSDNAMGAADVCGGVGIITSYFPLF